MDDFDTGGLRLSIQQERNHVCDSAGLALCFEWTNARGAQSSLTSSEWRIVAERAERKTAFKI